MAVNKAKILATAQKYLGRNQVDRAIRELQKIVKDDPKDLRVRQKIAELHGRQGQVSEAMREFQVVADFYERGGFYPKAAAIYKQMLRLEPDNMNWHLALGEIYQQLALLSDAMDHFNVVAEHYESNGSIKERIQVFQRLLKLNPDSIDYVGKLSELWRKEQDYEEAYTVYARLVPVLEQRSDGDALVRVFEHMADLKPDDLDLARRLANLYLDRGDPKRALAKLQVCFKADPQDTETLNLLADAFVDLGEREKAVAVLRELAQIYESLGYEEYRNQVYDRIAEIDPNAGSELEADATLEIIGNDDPVADIALAEPSELDEGQQRLVIEGEIYLQYGLPERAREHLERALAKHPGIFELHRAVVPLYVWSEDQDAAQRGLNAMYEIAMDRSDYRAARACLARATELSPDDETARARLLAFEDAMGDFFQEPESEPSDEVDLEDFGDAIELGRQIAGTVGDEPAPRATERDDDSFGFDDAEMQALAAQLESELSGAFGAVEEEPTVADERDAPRFGTVEAEPVDEDLAEAFESGMLDVSLDEEEPETQGQTLGGDDKFGFDLDLDFDDLDDFGDLEDVGRQSAFELGQSYYEAGAYDDAVLELRRAVDQDDRKEEAQELLALSLRRTRDFKGSVEVFRELLTSGALGGSKQLDVLWELGVTYEAAGSRRSAVKVYQKICKSQRGYRDGEAMARLSTLASQLGLR